VCAEKATARRPLDVAVVGGGIGGLAAALALVRSGLNAHVYEQAENWVGVGAGVTLGPNALRLLDRLGLAQRLEAIAAFPSGYAMRRGRDGKVIFRTDGSGPGRKTRSLTFHRAQLLKVLEQALPAERIHLDRRCIYDLLDGRRISRISQPLVAWRAALVEAGQGGGRPPPPAGVQKCGG
jgi:2-polyprenyl-6-methoxyphenol hydroxylase-like FAD-dependent oxidoreductase